MRIEPFRPVTYALNQINRAANTAASAGTPSVSSSESSTERTSAGRQTAPGRQVLEPGNASAPGTQFGEQVSQAIQHVDQLQKQADSLATEVATGGTEDAHKAVIAMEHALMSLDFTLQVRNKVLDAYQEIMKTQL